MTRLSALLAGCSKIRLENFHMEKLVYNSQLIL